MKNCELSRWLLEKKQPKTACVGLDGFIDRVVRVVDKRIDSENVTYIKSLADYGNRLAAAAGLSLNIELVCQVQKLGGNGPIMANAFAALGSTVKCIGNFGYPDTAPEFEPLKKRAELVSLGQSACTDAYEFDDGKIIASSLQPLNELDWQQILERVGKDGLVSLFGGADLIALNNWTMIPHMSDIWERLLAEIFPLLPQRDRLIFIDLADPSKRTVEDIRRALGLLGSFSKYGSVLLSCNKREALQLAAAMELDCGEKLEDICLKLQQTLNIKLVVIHTLKGSIGCEDGTVHLADGFYVAEPKISVGGGDHFNAGLAHGILYGLPLSDAMYLAAAESGYYVRNAESPDAAALSGFLAD